MLFGKPSILNLILVTAVYSQSVPKFMGRVVTIAKPKLDADGFFPVGPASVCIDGPPQRQCYTQPEDFGKDPEVSLVHVKKDLPALLFSAASGGVSGWRVHFALLRPDASKELVDLFIGDMEVSNQNQHAFWRDPSVSDSLIFLTAVAVWGPNEGHYGEHRYIVSAYVRKPVLDLADSYYSLEDRYMTVRSYDIEANADVLASEKPEILARLRRIAKPH